MRDRSEEITSDHNRSSGGPIQKYNVVDVKKLERMGYPLYRAADNENVIRILPPHDDELMFGRKVAYHDKVGPNGEHVLCPKFTHNQNNEPMGKPCVLCQTATAMWEADKEDQRAKDLFANDRWLFWIVDCSDEKKEELGPQLYDAPKGNKDAITGLCLGRRGGKTIDPSHPVHGRDILFVKTGKGVLTKYNSFQLMEPRPEIPKDWYAELPPFDDILYWHDPADVAEFVDGILSAEKPDPNDKKEAKKDEMPARKFSRRTSTPAPEEGTLTINEDAESNDESPFDADIPAKEESNQEVVDKAPVDTKPVETKPVEKPANIAKEEPNPAVLDAVQAKLNAFKNRKK